jgi:hypothetical protein
VKAEPIPGPLRFRGTPLLVEGLTPFRYQDIMAGAAVGVSLSKDSYKIGEPTNIQTVPAGETATWVRFSLALDTPAGTYAGEVKLADSAYTIIVDVESKPQLHLSPKGVTLNSARAGSTVGLELTATNSGNAAFEIPDVGTFGLFAAQGLERSIAEAVRAPASEGRQRLDKLMNSMSDEHGGFARVKVAEGAGPLAPGEFRNLKIKLRLPDGLKPGERYSGSWVVQGTLRFPVRVEVSAQAGKDTPGKEVQ